MYTQLEIESLLEGKLQIAYLNQPETFNSLNFTHDGVHQSQKWADLWVKYIAGMFNI